MKQWQATLLGFLAASALPAAALAIAFPLSGERDAASVFGSFFVALWYSALFVAILGVPMFLALRRIGVVRWWSASIGGAVGGMFITFILTSTWQETAVVRFTVLGAAAGLLFWACWRTGAGRDYANEPPNA